MSYLDVYKRRVSHLGTTPQDRAFNSGKLEFQRYLKYNQQTVRGLTNENSGLVFDGVIHTDKEDENRVSQILLVDLETPINVGDLVLWNEEHWLVYRQTTSAYQPHQKFYMVRCNYFIRWIDNGFLKESWVYLLGSKDAKIKDNFRTWNDLITPQPNKHISLIMPHQLMPLNTEIVVMDEVWYLVDYDQNSVPGVIYMSFTETSVNQQRDDIKQGIANIDTLAQWSIAAAASQQVKPYEEVIVDCYILKDGQSVEINPEELTFEIEGSLYLRDGKIYAYAEGTGKILIQYQDASFVQEIIIADEATRNPVLTGSEKIRATTKSEYILENADEVEFELSDTKLAKIFTVDGNRCVVVANDNNKLGMVELAATYNGITYTKQIQIVSLWQVI